jgi:hypothetical protein
VASRKQPVARLYPATIAYCTNREKACRTKSSPGDPALIELHQQKLPGTLHVAQPDARYCIIAWLFIRFKFLPSSGILFCKYRILKKIFHGIFACRFLNSTFLACKPFTIEW